VTLVRPHGPREDFLEIVDFIGLLRGSALQQQKSHGPLRLAGNQGKQVARENCSLHPEVAMNSLVPSTADANAYRADVRPTGVESRSCLKYAEQRFASVVLPHLADAHALARWLTGNYADSQDVVQDACLRALHGIGSFADGDARSWVLTIVRRTAFDWLNRNRLTANVRGGDMEALERTQLREPEVGSTETRLIDKEDEKLFDSAVAGLPPHYRHTLALRHVRGLTYREIAESTGVSIGTVMSRLSRARRHLISRMTNNETRKEIALRASRASCHGQRYTGNVSGMIREEKRDCFSNRHRTHPPSEIGVGHTRSVARRIENTR
jgi:RNA polymerase sigma factor (sigma-70 family)